MDHDKLKEDLCAYLDGELDRKKRAALETHLQECLNCQKSLQELRETWGLLLELPVPQASPDFGAQVWEKIRQQETSNEFPLTWLPRFAWALGCFLLIWIAGVGAGTSFFVRELRQKQFLFSGFFEKPWPTSSNSFIRVYERRKP